jgi:hypothetical protein
MPRTGALDLSKPPFRVPEGQDDAAAVAESFIACFKIVSALPDKVSTCVQAALDVAGLDLGDPLCVASQRIASDLDGGVGAGGANPYHNAQHFCEVVLSALYLSLLAGVAAKGKAELLAAALVHDFHHDGSTNANVPFRLERLSAEAAAPYLEAAGVPTDVQARIRAMIFSTEVSIGARFARECHLHFAASGPRASLSGIPAELAPLADDAGLALQAVIVGEADVLSSAGLTVQYGELQQEKLAEEWKKPLGADHKVWFLNQVFQDFTVGHFFAPNLRALKRAAQERAERERGRHPPR